MKKYKLIKEYPGSPKLNTEIVGTTTCPVPYITYMIPHTYSFSLKNPYDYPKFWQEIIEKEYEILAYVAIATNNIFDDIRTACYNKTKKQYWSKTSDTWINDLANSKYKIYSVKRLSDGEVFTIGDKLSEESFTNGSRHNLNNGPHDNLITKIAIVQNYDNEVAGYSNERTEAEKGKLMVSASNKWGNLNVSLKKAKHCRKPIFISTDGIKIFQDDIYHVPQTKDRGCTLLGTYMTFYANSTIQYYKNHPNTKRFSTKEVCEKYIADNMRKPLFTTEDGVDIFEGDSCYWILSSYKISSISNCNATNSGNPRFKHFSTQQKAEKYILFNKPCLSLNDVATVYITANRPIDHKMKLDSQTRRIMQLVKSKL